MFPFGFVLKASSSPSTATALPAQDFFDLRTAVFIVFEVLSHPPPRRFLCVLILPFFYRTAPYYITVAFGVF